MAINMMEDGRMIIKMGKELCNMLMAIDMKEIGRMDKNVE